MRTLITAAVLVAISTSADAAKLKPVRPLPFYAEAEFGQEVSVLRHGPLTLLLQCFEAEARSVAALLVVSDEDDMLITGEESILVPAGDNRTLFAGSVPSPDGAGYVSADDQTHITIRSGKATGGSAIGPSGWILSVPADSVGFGIATYRFSITPHAWEGSPDCFVTGFALLTKVRR